MMLAGVDLSWKCAPYRELATAICICDASGALQDPVLVTSDDEIIDVLNANDVCLVAIDASLKVPNQRGMRLAEKEAVSSGIHILPTNRTFLDKTCGGSRGEQLVLKLEVEDFVLAMKDQFEGRLIFETYPYGILHTIGRGHVPRYKKGPLETRKKACSEILRSLRSWEPSLGIPAQLEVDISSSTSSNIKSVCDWIDAMVCACCLYAHWSYQGKRTRMLGDANDGYLLLV